MNNDDHWIKVSIVLSIGIILLGIAGAFYSASVQADVYKRQGVEISTWEVMMGAKPIERVITVK